MSTLLGYMVAMAIVGAIAVAIILAGGRNL